MSLAVGDEVELGIERLAAGGDGLGHYEGRVVFVSYTAPGDRISVRVTEVRRRYARAELVSVLEAGPDRREPPCPHFGRCGGCTWMHLDDALQARTRLEILRDALVRVGRATDLPEIEWLPSPRTLGYRSRARVAVSETAIGFREAASRNVIDVERCAVLDSETQRALDDLRRGARSDAGTRDVEIRGFGGQAAGLRVGEGAFFQANGALWDPWAQTVAEACGEGEQIVELYAGVGFYTVHLATRFKRVIAVERARSARDLRHNTDAEVIQMSAEHFCLTQLAELSPDAVLLNPPRTGCDPVVIDALRNVVPQRTVYVSCDPATLARDIARMGDAFHVSRVVAIDALPQTHHVESLTVLSANE